MSEKIIYMGWIAAELKKQGFPILRVEINPHKPQFDCYVFEQTPELIEAFSKISNQRK